MFKLFSIGLLAATFGIGTADSALASGGVSMPDGTELRCTIQFGTDGTTCCPRRDGPDESLGDCSVSLQSDKLRNLPQLFVRAVGASSWQQGEQWHSVLSVAADVPGTSLEHAVVPDTKS